MGELPLAVLEAVEQALCDRTQQRVGGGGGRQEGGPVTVAGLEGADEREGRMGGRKSRGVPVWEEWIDNNGNAE